MESLIKNITWPNVTGTEQEIKGYVNNYEKNMKVYAVNLVINDGQVSFTAYSNISYDDLVVSLIRKNYSQNEELAILRKAINNITDEYHIYNAYVEQCKLDAKAFIEERERVLNGTNSITN